MTGSILAIYLTHIIVLRFDLQYKMVIQSNHDAFIAFSKTINTMYMKQRDTWKQYVDTDLVNTIGFAMNFAPNEDLIKEGVSAENRIFFSAEDVTKMQVKHVFMPALNV